MKNIILLLTIFVTFNIHAIDLPSCNNLDADQSEIVSDDYIFCINRNLVKLRLKLNLTPEEMPRCYNRDYSTIDYLFIECINDNLRTAGKYLEVKITYCPNMSTEHLNDSFVSCINGRFNRLSH